MVAPLACTCGGTSGLHLWWHLWWQAHLKESSYSEAAVGAILSNRHPIPSSRPIASPTLTLTLTPNPDPDPNPKPNPHPHPHPHPNQVGAIFDSIDVDDDGELSREERQHAQASPPRLTPRPAQREGDVEPEQRPSAAPPPPPQRAPGGSGRLRAALLGSGRPSGRPRHRLARSSPPLTTQEMRGGLARYGALRLALGVGTYYDYTQPSSGSKPVEYRYFW